MASKKALGRGLSALIPGKEGGEGSAGVILIPVDQIAPNPNQPRKVMAPEPLADLVESIRNQGVLQPVLVKRSASGYELIAGERRWRAAREAGLAEIPALVKEVGREESLVMAIVENIQRENLNPIESALAYQSLAEGFGLTQEDVARVVGKDRASVANYLRLLKLPQPVQEDVAQGRLSMGHARALLSIAERGKQLAARDRILSQDLSVRETERLVASLSHGRISRGRRKSPVDPHVAAIEEDLKRRLGTKVQLSRTGTGGTIRIHYHNADELERILELLQVAR